MLGALYDTVGRRLLFRLEPERAHAAAAGVLRALHRSPWLRARAAAARDPSLEEAAADYAESARRLAPVADYLVVNVSSPNTPGLRSLQAAAALGPVLDAVAREVAAAPRRVPLLVKIAPDLADEEVDAVVDLA